MYFHKYNPLQPPDANGFHRVGRNYYSSHISSKKNIHFYKRFKIKAKICNHLKHDQYEYVVLTQYFKSKHIECFQIFLTKRTDTLIDLRSITSYHVNFI